MLQRGELDLAIVRGPLETTRGTDQLALHHDELGVLMAANHPLTRHQQVTCRQLSGYELIWFPRHVAPGIYDAILEALARNGAHLTVTTGTDSMPAIAAALPLLPAAISLSTQHLAAGSPELAWRPLEGGPLITTVAAVWRSRPRHPALRALIAALRRSLADGPWQDRDVSPADRND